VEDLAKRAMNLQANILDGELTLIEDEESMYVWVGYKLKSSQIILEFP